MVVSLSKKAEEIADGKRLGGFGSTSIIDAQSHAKKLISQRHSQYTIKLGIPDLVVEIPEQEWIASTQETNKIQD